MHKGLTTGQISRITGVTVRALRYYDRIGLLKPSHFEGDTRLYNEEDIARLQKLSVLKFIGLSLEEMSTVMEIGSGSDLRSALQLQKQLIRQKIHHMESVVQAIDASMDYMEQQEQAADWEELARIIHMLRTERDWGRQYQNAARCRREPGCMMSSVRIRKGGTAGSLNTCWRQHRNCVHPLPVLCGCWISAAAMRLFGFETGSGFRPAWRSRLLMPPRGCWKLRAAHLGQLPENFSSARPMLWPCLLRITNFRS